MRRFAAACALGILALAGNAAAQPSTATPASGAAPAAAQSAKSFTLDGSRSRAFHAFTNTGPRRFESNEEAQSIVDRIAKFLPVWNDVKAFVTDDADAVANAAANFDPEGKPIIGFNRAYMRDLQAKAGNYWALVGIAAHEVGHHTGNHITMPQDNCKLNNDIELQADFYAGFALAKMGIKRDDAISTMRSMPQSATCTHPPRDQRLAVIGRGWTQAAGVQIAGLGAAPVAPVTPAPANPPGATTESGAARGAVPPVASAPAAPGASQPAASPTPPAQASQEAARTAAATVQALAKAPKTALDNFKIRRNRDVYGNDLEKLPGLSENDCAQRCLSHGQCKGFSYDRWNAWCFLKSDLSTSLVDAASYIAVKSSASFPAVATSETEVHKLRRKKFTDPAFATTTVPTYDACLGQCTNTKECMAFTFAKTSGVCQMHQNTVGHFYDENFDGGFKRQLPEGATRIAAAATKARIEIEKGRYFNGDGYDKHEDASIKDCEALCLKDGRCKALEYVEAEKTCRLYARVEPAAATPGTSVGFKRSD